MAVNVVQVAHITRIPGPVQFLARFLNEKKGFNCWQIYHPLDESISNSTLTSQGKIIAQKRINVSGLLKYFVTFSLSLKWLGKSPQQLDWAIGMNCLDTFSLLVAKKFRKISQVVFFNTDFSRRRFKNPLLNSIYVALDRWVAKRADLLCCNTKRTIQARIKEGISENKIILTPNGVFLSDIGFVKKNKSFLPQLVYVGSLNKDHGLQNIFSSLGKTKLKLFIIGSGPDEKHFKMLVRKYQLEKQISFLGFMDHDRVVKYLKNFSGFGLAPYPSDTNWAYYADPVKIKEYLACLVPPVISSVVEISQEIKQKRLGLVYQKNPSKTFKEIASMNNKDYQQIIANIISKRTQLDYNYIYQKIFD
ncbi:MAG: glycosyltransferase [Candidatus Shapirobacteria bacterium]|nr:glycosyltransferase [Candidatus Shapirobacteria bacterium]